jgi:hypothetical protein
MRHVRRRFAELLESRHMLDATVVFNEVMYHPANDGVPEWIELHNQMSVDMDLSGWKLKGGVNYSFPAGTLIARQGYLVVSADPMAMSATTGYSGAIGPWVGSLDNSGEQLDLVNNTDRLMNRVEYGDNNAWPVGPDGTGATLSKANPDAASEVAEDWKTSAQVGGTPGRENFPPYAPTVRDTNALAIDGTWSYHDGGIDLGTTWKNTGFDASSWSTGHGLFYDETAALPAPKNTPLTPGRTTYYFRTQFAFAGDPTKTELRLRPIVDDGAVYYLNGVEIYRQNMPTGAVNYNTLASGKVGDATFAPTIALPAGSLTVGNNVLAVEVHQSGASAKAVPHNFAEYNTTVNGYQDAFDNTTLNPAWTAVGTGTWTQNGDGYLHASSGGTDPSKLLYNGAAYNGSVQNVLAMVRVTAFSSNGDTGARAGVASVSSPAAAHPGEGINYIFYGNGNEIQKTEFLNDYIAHGPTTVTTTRTVGTDYWVRLLHEPNKSAGSDPLFNGVNDSFAKIWPADGVTPEPTTYQYSWASNDTRTGLAGLSIGFDNLTKMDVGYILIQASGLPSTQVVFDSGGGGPSLDDVVFGAEVVTRETLPDPALVQVKFNEIAPANGGPFFVELMNYGTQTTSLDGVVVARLGVTDAQYTISNLTLAPGQRLMLDAATLGFTPEAGDRVVLFTAGKTSVLDAVTADDRLRGRSPEGTGDWHFPSAATPGAANQFDFADEVVINEVMYHARPTLSTPGTPATYQTTPLVAINATTQWRYFVNTNNAGLPSNWYQTTYASGAGGWQQGAAPFGYEVDPIPEPIRTTFANPSSPPANPFIRTYYFQTTFNVSDPTSIDALTIRHEIDDGAVFYLNGHEIDGTRFNMPGATGDAVSPADIATPAVGNAVFVGPIAVDASLLHAGQNVLSVEVHQASPATSSDIVFAMELNAAVFVTPPISGTPFEENPLEWVELYNRSATPVDLGGWKLKEAIQYQFPANTILGAGQYLVVPSNIAAFNATYPGAASLGEFSGSLANSGDRILLDDAFGNPADEVNYFDGGHWPEMADGHGASLELRDPDADNSQGEAWAASDEAARSEWHTYTYRGNADNHTPGAPTLWQEFAFGLLDGAGEVWIDDVSVIETPSTTPIQRIQNGSFNAGASTWRMLGDHQSSQVIAEPGNPGNMILRMVADGPTEYQGNQIETTFGGGATIVEGREYEISFRAKWIAGSHQINSRLYWNRLARTTPLIVPTLGGTPGAANSRRVVNIGPTYDGMIHSPAVPEANAPVTVSVNAADPENMASVALKYSVNAGAWQNATMVSQGGGRYAATIPGQSAGALVQFYVEGTDGAGAVSQYPAGGVNSRALIRWNDNQATTGLLTNFRILMTAADTTKLHYGPNTTSNQALGGTVIYNENEIFYDIGVHLKGSFVGRDTGRTGFHVKFNPDQLFRGVYDKVAIDRSETVTAISPTETLAQLIANHAGGVLPSRYDDLIYVIAPRSAQTSVAYMRMAGWDEVFLDEQFENGSDSDEYDFEVIRWATNTIDGNPQSIKQSFPDSGGGQGSVNVDIQDLGSDKEAYRWNLNLIDNRERDDYEDLIELAKTFSLSGTALDAAAAETMDIDEWMRVFAFEAVVGLGDGYNRGDDHNLRIYIRPEDGKALALPHDWDNVFRVATSQPLIGGKNVAKIINRPQNLHYFYGHLQDIVNTTFNTTYMAYWTNHYGQVAGRDFTFVLNFVAGRSAYINSQLAALAPQIPFAVTTSGAGLSVDATTADIVGNGWINVRTIRLAGSDEPLEVTWLNQTQWRVTVPVAFGANPLTFQAFDFQGNPVGASSIVVNSSVSDRPLQDFLRIAEVMYHPADPSAAELAAGYTDSDDFEFLEFVNTSATVSLPLAGVAVAGVAFDFTDAAIGTLAPGERLVIVRNADAFAFRYGAGRPVAGKYSGRLDNAGEALSVTNGDGAPIQSFVYDDVGPGWYPSTDGEGYSLVIVNPLAPVASWNDPAAWRPSLQIGGSPGTTDMLPGDFNGDSLVDLGDLAILQAHFGTTSGALPQDGDMNADGRVNRTDAARFAVHFGSNIAPGSPAAAGAWVNDSAVQAAAAQAEAIVQRSHAAANRLVARRRPLAANEVDRAVSAMDAAATLSASRVARLKSITARSID